MLPEGSRDLLPLELIRQDKLRDMLLTRFRSWGYQPVLPPTLESLEAIERGRPQFIRDSFKVIDQDGCLLALRPDLTLPIARLAATRLSQVERPLRLCYAAAVFRPNAHLADERREIYQAGIELIGAHRGAQAYTLEQTNKANLECLSLLIETLQALKLPGFKIVLSHTDLWRYAGEIFRRVQEHLDIDLSHDLDRLMRRGDFVEYQKSIKQAEDRCRRSFSRGTQKVTNELQTVFEAAGADSPLSYLNKACYELTGKPEQILSYFDADSDLAKELSGIISLEKIFGEDIFLVDLTMRPDPDFYTGLFFQVIIPQQGRPIASGGRYNNLISCFGISEPAIGFSLQLDHLLRFSKSEVLNEPVCQAQKVCVTSPTGDLLEAIVSASKLRETHETVVLD